MMYLVAILIGFFVPVLIVSLICEIFNLSTNWRYKWLKYILITIFLLLLLSISPFASFAEKIGELSLYLLIILIIIKCIKNALIKSKNTTSTQLSIIKINEVTEYSTEALEYALHNNSDKYSETELNIIKTELDCRNK